ncbi:MAG: hypothetical protein IKI78_01380 [Clostridia bacterium]|nr:hypothetical protein [Clostridia bacterium]
MKKILAVLLALVMAFSCMALAFAEDDTTTPVADDTTAAAADDTTTTTAAAEEETKGGLLVDKGSFFDMTATDIIDALIAVFDTHADWWDAVENIIIRLIDFINNIGIGAASKADVAGAISDLEAKIASLPIVGNVLTTIHNLITSLKQKIKDLYAGNKETVIEETDAAPSADTGSSSLGIAAFAAISVAAAAAYVCTKKKAA